MIINSLTANELILLTQTEDETRQFLAVTNNDTKQRGQPESHHR